MKYAYLVAAFLPLPFAASLPLLVPSQGKDLTTITLNGMPCGPEGTAKSAPAKAIDRAKNRWDFPKETDIDPEVSLAAMLAPGPDKNRFNPKKAATMRGLVIDVLMGGKETCNCEAVKEDERDTHIELGLAVDATEIQRVIVEVTPRFRMPMKAKNQDWSTPALRQTIKGKWVEVTGWLLFDTPHITQAENTNPGNPENWRATCWELHPLTSISVLDQAPGEAANFRSTSLTALQGLHAAHLARSANGRSALEALHKASLEGFDASDLAEAKEEAESRRQKNKNKN
jgi:hypothetical protein